MDLVSGDGVMDALSGVLDAILNTISDVLAQNVLQWLGSLVGLVAPEDIHYDTSKMNFQQYRHSKKANRLFIRTCVQSSQGRNLIVGGSMPTHQTGIAECSGIELEYLEQTNLGAAIMI